MPLQKKSTLSEIDIKHLKRLEETLGYTFQKKELLHSACHVKSVGQRKRNIQFERLEFLGDRVLGLSMAEILLHKHPHASEGELAKKFSALVSKTSCQKIAETLNLKDTLLHFAGTQPLHTNALSDGVEAILGAIMQDADFETAHKVVAGLWHDFVSGEKAAPKDPKTFLQEHTQKHFQTVPVYTILERTGPDHAPFFKLSVTVTGPLSKKPKSWTDSESFGDVFTATAFGEGDTKRKAEQHAAENFLKKYR